MKILIQILILASIILGLAGCGPEAIEPEPPLPPPVIAPSDLLGTWEIYNSRKDIVSKGVNYQGFRDPEMDGFKTKFYEGQNGAYLFTSYNAIGVEINRGSYDISDNNIILNTEAIYEEKGNVWKDSTYIVKQKLIELQKEAGLLAVDYSYSLTIEGVNYQISDIRRLRNVDIAPKAQQGVLKAKVMVNFDDYVGTWQVFNVDVLVGGTRNANASRVELDAPNITSFRFFYDEAGRKMGQRSVYYPVEDSISALPPMPVVIVDDVIHMLFKVQLESGEIENSGIFLWITKREPYTDPNTGRQTEMILDSDAFRDKDDPLTLYERYRSLMKVE